MSLPDLRDQLDAVDEQIVRLLRERAGIAASIGEHKRQQGLPFYAPERERQILDRVAGMDRGEFPLRALFSVFRTIMAACRGLQEPARIAFLGPAGTFTEIAARSVFGFDAQYLPQPDFAGVFAAVAGGHADHGVVPIENSTAGTIREALDLLAGTPLTIVAECYQDIHHCLLSHADQLDDVTTVYSKDAALDQCRLWLQVNLSEARLEPVPSTADGARRAAATPGTAAIAPELAGELYDLPILARHIEDRSDNRTRFFVLGHDMPEPSGNDKTSLVIAVPHQPGALVDALEIVRRHRLNMTLIESRPSPYAAFEYVFYIDIEGHAATAEIEAALDDLHRVCMLTQVLGSYPRAAG